jgi:hypothetical protein
VFSSFSTFGLFQSPLCQFFGRQAWQLAGVILVGGHAVMGRRFSQLSLPVASQMFSTQGCCCCCCHDCCCCCCWLQLRWRFRSLVHCNSHPKRPFPTRCFVSGVLVLFRLLLFVVSSSVVFVVGHAQNLLIYCDFHDLPPPTFTVLSTLGPHQQSRVVVKRHRLLHVESTLLERHAVTWLRCDIQSGTAFLGGSSVLKQFDSISLMSV